MLAGLQRRGLCDSQIQFRDSGKAVVYRCQGLEDRGRVSCISFGVVRADAAVGAAMLQALKPLGIEAALPACAAREHEDAAAIRLVQSALTEARYRADRAEAQFQAVEPANQNVFHNLTRQPRGLPGPRPGLRSPAAVAQAGPGGCSGR